MEVLVLTIFVSMMLVTAAGLFFAWNVRQRSHEQSDRLVLLPLAEESTTPHRSGAGHGTDIAPRPIPVDARKPAQPGAPHSTSTKPIQTGAALLQENRDDNN